MERPLSRAATPQPWHGCCTDEQRRKVISCAVRSIFPTLVLNEDVDPRIKELIYYVQRLELKLFEAAADYQEYLRIFSERLCVIRSELEEKKMARLRASGTSTPSHRKPPRPPPPARSLICVSRAGSADVERRLGPPRPPPPLRRACVSRAASADVESASSLVPPPRPPPPSRSAANLTRAASDASERRPSVATQSQEKEQRAKPWQLEVTAGDRNQNVSRLVKAMLPASNMTTANRQPITILIQNACKVEMKHFETAESREEYDKLISSYINRLQGQADRVRRVEAEAAAAALPDERWRAAFSSETRAHYAVTLATAVSPSANPAELRATAVQNAIKLATRIERRLFAIATSDEDYFELLSKKIVDIFKLRLEDANREDLSECSESLSTHSLSSRSSMPRF